MAVKRKLSKAEFESLSDEAKTMYIENKDRRGEYILDMDPDFNKELQTVLDTQKTTIADLEGKVAEGTAALAAEQAKKISKDGSVSKEDFEAYKTSAEKKYTTDTAALNTTIGKKDATIKTHLIDNVANGLATKLSKSPKLMLPHVKSRLAVDMSGDEPKTIVLDADGRPSAFTIQDLEQEFVANKDFADILIGSRASGGNPPPSTRGNPLSPEKPQSLTSMKPADVVAEMKARHPELAKT